MPGFPKASTTTAVVLMTALAYPVHAQRAPDGAESKAGGSTTVQMLSRLPLGGFFSTGGLEIESEPSRPYVYVSRMLEEAGFTIVSVADPRKPKIVFEWRIPDVALHSGLGGENGKYFKLKGRYYYAKCFSFEPNTADADLSVIVFDVTGLPDGSKVKEVGRIRAGGVTHVYPYKHSDGRVLLVATTSAAQGASIYDMEKLIAGDPNQGLLSVVPVPGAPAAVRAQDGSVRGPSYHDTYLAYDPTTRQDKLYGAGTGGFQVFDVTRPEEPKHLFAITPGAGVSAGGHTIIASPDGRYAVAQVERQYWPLMVFDMKPGIDKQATVIGTPVGAWTADWRDASHTNDVRWPYVFIAAFEDGLQILSLSDPKSPRNVGWYYTCECAHQTGWGGVRSRHGTTVMNGAADVDVRNADGLIVLTDYTTGLWVFKLQGLDGWNGKDWQVPNISSEQDWDKGPISPARPAT